jgi:copper transport protein
VGGGPPPAGGGRRGAGPPPPAPEAEHEHPVGPDARAPDTADRATLPAGTVPRWLQLLGVVLLLGAVASRFGVIPMLARNDALPELCVRLRKGFWRAGWLAVILLLVGLPLRLWVQFGGEGAEWTTGEIVSFLFGTAWGAGWFLHLAVVLLGGLGLLLAAPRGMNDRGWTVLAVAALLLPLVSGLQGHAWGVDELRSLAVSSIYLHVLGVGVWLGGLVLLLLVGLPAVRAEAKRRSAAEEVEEETVAQDHNPHPPLFRLVNAFSRMVLPFVALFVVTGVVNSWIHLGGSVDAFVGTTYGRTLLLKLGFVAGALVLGFYNWRRVRPSLAANPDPGALRIPASVEAVLALLALLVTSALVAIPHH